MGTKPWLSILSKLKEKKRKETRPCSFFCFLLFLQQHTTLSLSLLSLCDPLFGIDTASILYHINVCSFFVLSQQTINNINIF